MGDLVSNDEKSAAIIVPLMDINPETGDRLDYADLKKSSRKSGTNSPEIPRSNNTYNRLRQTG